MLNRQQMEMFEYLTKEDKKKGTNSAYDYLVKTKGERYAKQTFSAAKKHHSVAGSGNTSDTPSIVYIIIGGIIGYIGATYQYSPQTLTGLLDQAMALIK
jgi:hypothetical protein